MPKFNRISLAGSDELFRPTQVDEAEEAIEASPADTFSGRTVQPPRAPTPAPLSTRDRNYVRLQLTEEQLQVLVDSVQRMKYPHMAAAAHQPSVEEFEALEALRNVLLDAVE